MIRTFMLGDGWTITGSTVDLTTTKFTTAPPVESFGNLVDRVSAKFDTEGVLLLGDDATAATLGWPGPAIADAEAHGWQHGAVDTGPWLTMWRKGAATVHVASLNDVERQRFQVFGPWLEDVVHQHTLWHELVGAAYHHTPGIAALAALRGRPWKRQPTWRLLGEGDTSSPLHEAIGCERPFHVWDSPQQPLSPDRLIVDGVRAGLAAIVSSEVAPYAVKFHNHPKFSALEAGYWLCDLPGWQHPDMPSPLGQHHGAAPSVAWLSTPSVKVLRDLAEDGDYGGPLIRQSWTAPAARVLRSWGEHLRDAYNRAAGMAAFTDPNDLPDGYHDGANLAQTIKDGYRQAHGNMAHDSGGIYRPDWNDALTAVQRVNTWRRAWTLYKRTGIAPVRVVGDAFHYQLTTAAEVAQHFRRDDQLGAFHHTVSGSAPFERGADA